MKKNDDMEHGTCDEKESTFKTWTTDNLQLFKQCSLKTIKMILCGCSLVPYF